MANWADIARHDDSSSCLVLTAFVLKTKGGRLLFAQLQYSLYSSSLMLLVVEECVWRVLRTTLPIESIRKTCSMLTWDFVPTSCWEKNPMLALTCKNFMSTCNFFRNMRFFFEHACLEKNHMFGKKSHVDMELFMFNMTTCMFKMPTCMLQM